MIKIRDFTFDIQNDLKIDLIFRDRLINKNDIECIQKSNSIKYFFSLQTSNNTGQYLGYIIDEKNQIVKDINKIKRMLK